MLNKSVASWSNRKMGGVPSLGRKRSCLKRIRGYDTGKYGGGSRHSFTNDKNSVIAENVLSYFLCLSSTFETKVACFETKQQLLIFCYEIQIY